MFVLTGVILQTCINGHDFEIIFSIYNVREQKIKDFKRKILQRVFVTGYEKHTYSY
jgi:hypothetical protein